MFSIGIILSFLFCNMIIETCLQNLKKIYVRQTWFRSTDMANTIRFWVQRKKSMFKTKMANNIKKKGREELRRRGEK